MQLPKGLKLIGDPRHLNHHPLQGVRGRRGCGAVLGLGAADTKGTSLVRGYVCGGWGEVQVVAFPVAVTSLGSASPVSSEP